MSTKSIRRLLSLLSAASLVMVMLPTAAGAAQRTWIGGNADRLDNGNPLLWNPADEPDPDEGAIFNANNALSMATDNEIQTLTLSGGIDLSTNGNDLTVHGLVQAADAGTNFFIDGCNVAGCS